MQTNENECCLMIITIRFNESELSLENLYEILLQFIFKETQSFRADFRIIADKVDKLVFQYNKIKEALEILSQIVKEQFGRTQWFA